MKNSFTNNYNQKNKNFSFNQKNNDDIHSQKINMKFDILSSKVLSKHDNLTNEKRRYLKERRLNTIFNKNNYYYQKYEMNKNNDLLQKNNYSAFLNEKASNNFLEKYKELFGLTTNNDKLFQKNINKDKTKNTIVYYLNILKFNNEKNNSINSNLNIFIPSKIANMTQRKIKYNNLNNNTYKIRNNGNSSMRNIKEKKIEIYNSLLGTQNSSRSNMTDILINLNNNFSNRTQKSKLQRMKSLNIYSFNKSVNKISKGNVLQKKKTNDFLDQFSFEPNQERFDYKYNIFKSRLNLLSLK